MEKLFITINLGLVLIGVILCEQQIELREAPLAQRLAPPLYTLDAKFVEIVTFGHEELYEHFLSEWVAHVLYDRQLPKDAADVVANIMAGIVKWGPKLEAPYVFGCSVFFDHFQQMERCEPILQAGIRNVKKSWFIPALLALAKLNLDEDPVEIAALFYLASERPGAPTSFKLAAKNILAEANAGWESLEKVVQSMNDVPEAQKLNQFLNKR